MAGEHRLESRRVSMEKSPPRKSRRRGKQSTRRRRRRRQRARRAVRGRQNTRPTRRARRNHRGRYRRRQRAKPREQRKTIRQRGRRPPGDCRRGTTALASPQTARGPHVSAMPRRTMMRDRGKPSRRGRRRGLHPVRKMADHLAGNHRRDDCPRTTPAKSARNPLRRRRSRKQRPNQHRLAEPTLLFGRKTPERDDLYREEGHLREAAPLHQRVEMLGMMVERGRRRDRLGPLDSPRSCLTISMPKRGRGERRRRSERDPATRSLAPDRGRTMETTRATTTRATMGAM